MAKPDWLIEAEKKKNRPEPITCETCVYFYGKFSGYTKYKDKKNCEIWECELHDCCMNTKFSVRCTDYMQAML